jgi:hypothetical protein
MQFAAGLKNSNFHQPVMFFYSGLGNSCYLCGSRKLQFNLHNKTYISWHLILI